MATNITAIPDSWLQILTGPQTGVAIQPIGGAVEYRLDTSLPGVDDRGHTLRLEEGHTVTLASGENLYAQSLAPSGTTASLAVTN